MVARGDRTHRLARSRSCDHTLRDTCELLPLCQRWRQCHAPRAGLRVQSLCPCVQCPGKCLCILSTHHFVLCRQNIHDTPLSFPSTVHPPTSREQGLLFEDRLGDPLLTSGLGTCIMLEEFIQSKNPHKHHHMLLCVFRILSCSELRARLTGLPKGMNFVQGST